MVEVDGGKDNIFRITMKVTARVWILRGDKKETVDEWVSKIQEHISRSTVGPAPVTVHSIYHMSYMLGKKTQEHLRS